MQQYYDRCSRLKYAGTHHQPTCSQGQDIALCGVACPMWQSKTQESFATRMRGIQDFFGFLTLRGYIQGNWTRDTIRQWTRSVKWSGRAEDIGFRPTATQMRRFLNGLPLYRRAPCATMAKTGLRIHEMSLLRLEDVDLDTGWLSVPRGGKRKGNPHIPIDSELRNLLRAYTRWRERIAKPGATSFFLNYRGHNLAPASPSQGQLNQKWFQKDAVRLGLQKPDAPPKERWHSHSMRHFYSDSISEAGCPDPWYGVLRGDRVLNKKNRDRYTDTARRDRIQSYYHRYAPIIGISSDETATDWDA